MRSSIIAALLIAVAALRIASTYRTFSAIVDEATHVGAGLELLQFHRYTIQPENPPLPRVIWASIAWAGGMRIDSSGSFLDRLRSVFYGHGNYRTNLVLARVGNLLFFVLAALALWLAARDALGERGALLALLLFTTEPIVLGYCGLANHDAPAVAGVAIALLAFSRWLQQPDAIHSFAVGAAYAFSILCKFSCIVFIPAACAAMFLVRLRHDPHPGRPAAVAKLVLIVVATSCLLLWAGYGFTIDRVPAPDFLIGVKGLLRIESHGVLAYLCGEQSNVGWWWYFPFAVALKTTLTLFALFAIGGWFAIRTPDLRWSFAEWTFCALMIIAVTLKSSLDLGVRYVLPFYVPFAIATAAAAVAMLRSGGIARVAAVTILVIHISISAFAHPDYFPYFNALAGRDPSRYLIDSNLDWGQDLLRLSDALQRSRIDRVGLSLLTGVNDYDALGFPPRYPLHPWRPSHGWIAVSDHSYRMTKTEGGWMWLEGKPYRRIGKSIRLYDLQ
jgi:4-amino-4-deoxy-L-arabinose transferase-like glycosyltransferase